METGRKTSFYFFTLFLVFVVFFALGVELPVRQNGGFFSDEAGYFPIIQSLAYDFDIKYERKDLFRIRSYFHNGPNGIFLKKGPDNEIYYAKSFAYPLLAAPFFRLFGVKGLVLFNGLMIFLAILMAFFLLKKYHPEPQGFSFALIFILASVTPVYIWWITADLFNFFVMFAGLFFFFYPFKRPVWFYLSAVFFSLSVFSKPWNAAMIGIIFLILLYRKEWKKFLLLSLVALVVFSTLVGFLALQTGELSYSLFQGGERRTFINDFPYDTDEPALQVFARGINMSFDGYWNRLHLTPKIIIANLFYFFFGRFTGIFIYFFPACFLLVLFFLQRKIPEDWFIFTAIITGILVFTLLAADNYFGGSGAVGNRYFFNIFPLFFFLGFKNRLFRFSIVPLVIAVIFLPGVLMDSLFSSSTPRKAGLTFPACLFPPEKTQYLSLPTNENPRAFGKVLHDQDEVFQLYFLNDDFHEIEGDAFWTKADKPCEFFLATPRPVKVFRLDLRSNVDSNKVTVDIEYVRKQTLLDAQKDYTVRFERIEGLEIKDRVVYYFKIKSQRYWGGYDINNPSPDKRELGVLVRLGVEYGEKEGSPGEE